MTYLPKFLVVVAVTLAGLIPIGNSVQAGVMTAPPDITVTRLSADFTNGQLSMDGWARYFVPLGGGAADRVNIYHNGSENFELNASFDANGNFELGDFTITGALKDSNGDIGAQVTLLKGTLTEASTAVFGSMGVVDFEADTLSGELESGYQGLASLRLSYLPSGLSFLSNFSFSNTGQADIARPVPEPATCFSVVALCMLGCFGRRRQKNRTISQQASPPFGLDA